MGKLSARRCRDEENLTTNEHEGTRIIAGVTIGHFPDGCLYVLALSAADSAGDVCGPGADPKAPVRLIGSALAEYRNRF